MWWNVLAVNLACSGTVEKQTGEWDCDISSIVEVEKSELGTEFGGEGFISRMIVAHQRRHAAEPVGITKSLSGPGAIVKGAEQEHGVSRQEPNLGHGLGPAPEQDDFGKYWGGLLGSSDTTEAGGQHAERHSLDKTIVDLLG